MTTENSREVDIFERTASILPFARNSATSGTSTTDSAPINVTGAIISGNAIPATLPYCAVASASVRPAFTSILGRMRAVSDAPREVIIRVAERGMVFRVNSLKPLGFVSLPPVAKNSTRSISTHARSEIVIASAIFCAPLRREIKPPVNAIESAILTISSISSVDENAKNFFLPQNQLRSDA